MLCIICKGDMKNGKVNFPVDLGENFILVKGVPAQICEQCGEFFLKDGVAEAVEEIVRRAKRTNVEIEILKFAA